MVAAVEQSIAESMSKIPGAGIACSNRHFGYPPCSSATSVVNINYQRSWFMDQNPRISDDLFIDPWSLVIERSTGANDIIFCGYRFDPETRLYYVRNRMYIMDTDGISVGRWLQRDPIGYAGGINLYEYVGGRVTVEVDPTGAIWQWVQNIWDFFTGVTPGGEFVEGAETVAELAKKGGWCLPAHLRRDHDACLDKHLKKDPLYQGLSNLCNHRPLTPQEYQAVLYAMQHGKIP